MRYVITHSLWDATYPDIPLSSSLLRSAVITAGPTLYPIEGTVATRAAIEQLVQSAFPGFNMPVVVQCNTNSLDPNVYDNSVLDPAVVLITYWTGDRVNMYCQPGYDSGAAWHTSRTICGADGAWTDPAYVASLKLCLARAHHVLGMYSQAR